MINTTIEILHEQVAITKGKAIGNSYLFVGSEIMKHNNIMEGITSEQLSKH